MSWERATGLYRQPLTGQPWNPSRCPISPFLTLLFLCVWGGCGWKRRHTDLSAWLMKCQYVSKHLAFFSYYSLYSLYALCLVPCNVNHVRSWHKKSGPWEKVREQVRASEVSCVYSLFILNLCHKWTCFPHHVLVPSVQNSVNLSFCISADGKHLPDILGEPIFHICTLLRVRKLSNSHQW